MTPVNSKNILIGILAFTTIGCGLLAWQQYRRASALGAEIASLGKAAAERARPRVSENRSPSAPADAGPPAFDAPPPDAAQGPGRGDWQNRMGNMRALLDSPEAAKLMASQQRGMLDTRYAALFKALNLPPEQLAKLKDFLVEKQNAVRDVMSVAREQGLDFRAGRGEMLQLIQQANADIDAGIIAAIGQDKFAQYQSYEQTQPQRAVADQVGQRLSYTGEPLTQAQSDQLVILLADSASATGGGPRTFAANYAGPPGAGGINIAVGVQITDQIINNAQSFLSPAQADALRQMQTEQSDQRKLQQLLMGGNSGGAPGAGNDTDTGTGNPNRRRRGR